MGPDHINKNTCIVKGCDESRYHIMVEYIDIFINAVAEDCRPVGQDPLEIHITHGEMHSMLRAHVSSDAQGKYPACLQDKNENKNDYDAL